MTTKHIFALFAILLVTACSGNKDKGALTDEALRTQDVGAVSEEVYGDGNGYGANTLGAAGSGTQEDLVVNVGDRVYFGYDRYDLTEDARKQLEAQAAWMKNLPSVTVTIEGHADERGTREYNLALGDRRATAVRNYLIALGVDASKVSTISYGKERPVALGSNPEAWAQNRRGVTVVN